MIRSLRNKPEFNELKGIDRFQYNCGGFALNTPKWVAPYVKDEDAYKVDDEVDCALESDVDCAPRIVACMNDPVSSEDDAPALSEYNNSNQTITIDLTQIKGNMVRLSKCIGDPNYTEYERTMLIQEYHTQMSYEEVTSIILEKDVEFLLQSFPFLERVDLCETKQTDKLIAYRFFYHIDQYGDIDDTDFHFRVRVNGTWYEKSGSWSVRPCSTPTIDYPWPFRDGYQYDSAIIYFKDTRYC